MQIKTKYIWLIIAISFFSCKNDNAEKIEALEQKIEQQKVEMQDMDAIKQQQPIQSEKMESTQDPVEVETKTATAEVHQKGKPIDAYIPQGYEVINKAKGNLNLDTKDDFILVLKKSNTTGTTQVLLLTNTGNNFYELRAKNDDIIYYEENLELDVVVNKGYFSFEIMYIPYAGSEIYKRIVTFRYDKNKDNWFLHKDGAEETNRVTGEVETTEVKTKNDFGIIPFNLFHKNY